ncbi:MAG: rubrerythrin family protein [Clostridia bacterium]|nr:rubrerythrin family protein [Clostridia bacterium]
MASYTVQENILESLKGSRTEQNLHTALSGESQAYLRYRWFEAKARSDGYEEIADIFAETAGNEKEHAEIWFRYLGGWSGTERNLEAAAGGEHFEWETMYAEFAATARAEGFEQIAYLFDRVAEIEKRHEERYLTYLKSVREGSVFTSDSAQTKWICLNCGYVITAKEPPQICPVCSHSQAYFKKTN